MKVLVVEDDRKVAGFIEQGLREEGYVVDVAADGDEATMLAHVYNYDIILLDLVLPRKNGFQVATELRREGRNIPILMLTSRDSVEDVVRGLDAGADDYLPKPFEPRELLARVKALLRRAAPATAPDEVLRFGRLEIDLGERKARLDGRECDLTGHQFDLLVVLAQSAGRVLSRDALMNLVRGEPLEAFDRSIDVHVSRIRAAIEDDPKHPRRILTLRGAGYVFARRQDEAD